ncbi:MAG: RES family NAD+ phosphorylase [Bacteroidales bacterium]|nr:RES family NAD+ phosphorylase [Bacteroidales bacterium]
MDIFRITKAEHAGLEGIGGLMVSGRWHNKGERVVYFSENRSLAVLEYQVHIGDRVLFPANLVLLTLSIPDDIQVHDIEIKKLANNWKDKSLHTRHLGSIFLKENKFLLLRVPSVIVPGEFNFLYNPMHPDAKRCKQKTEPFIFDERIK